MNLEYLKSEVNNSQFDYEEFRVRDIKCLIEKFDQLEQENKKLKEENELLSEHCIKLEEPIIDKIMAKLNSKSL